MWSSVPIFLRKSSFSFSFCLTKIPLCVYRISSFTCCGHLGEQCSGRRGCANIFLERWLNCPSSIFLEMAQLSHGSSVFSFLRDFCIGFHSAPPRFHPHRLCKRVSFPPLPRQLFFLALLMLPILTGVRWNLKAVLVAKDVEHFFQIFICISSSENFLFSSLVHLSVGYLVFNVWSSLYIESITF